MRNLCLPQGSEYVLASTAHGCELARVPCSSWRRPLAFTPPCPAHPAAFSLAFIQDRAVQIRRRRPHPCFDAHATPSAGAPNGSGDQCGLPSGDGQVGQEGSGGLGGGVGCSGAFASNAASASSDTSPQQGFRPVQALSGAVPSASSARMSQQGPGLAQPYALHAPHHGLDVTCVLALAMEDAAGQAGAQSPRCAAAACPGGSGAGGFCMGPSLSFTAVVTGSDDGTLRRLVHNGRCGGEPRMGGFPNSASHPLVAAEGPCKEGVIQCGTAECCVPGRSGGGGTAEKGAHVAGTGACSPVWRSAQMGAHVEGTTVKALAAVPWPQDSGAPAHQ